MPLDPNAIADPNATMPANSAPVTDATAAPAAGADTSGIPEEVLALPIMHGLLQGAPAAVWAPIGTKGPEVATVLKNGPALLKAGFAFYRDKKEGLDLFYNQRFISPELVQKAAEKGKLKDISSPLADVSASVNAAVGAPPGVVPPDSAGGPPAGPVGASGPTSLAPTPINTARLSNLAPGSPTSGPSPGAGRVFNSLQKQAV